MSNLRRSALPVLILAASAVVAWRIMESAPVPKRTERPAPRIAVEAMRVQPESFTVEVPSQGTVQPKVASDLVAEVSGVVREISPSLRNGGFFEEGEVLLRIDPVNYELALTSATARVAEAEAALEQELAEAEVVAEDWQRLGKKAPELGLRKPQIAAARAALASAEADVERARVDLARTVIRAPYDGRARTLSVDVGQFVNVGTVAAEIWSTAALEVRLPLAASETAYLDLPERFAGDGEMPSSGMPKATLTATIGRERYAWEGRVTRVESAFDEQSRQLYVVAEIAEPYRRTGDGRPPLRVGQFVTARIEGETLNGVYLVPRVAMRERDQVLVVTPESTLERREVEVVWTTRDSVVVDAGLEPGEIVSLTQPDIVTEGTPVDARIDGIPLEKLAGGNLAAKVRERAEAGGDTL